MFQYNIPLRARVAILAKAFENKDVVVGLVCQSDGTRLQFGADLSWPPTLRTIHPKSDGDTKDQVAVTWLETLDGIKYSIEVPLPPCVGMVVALRRHHDVVPIDTPTKNVPWEMEYPPFQPGLRNIVSTKTSYDLGATVIVRDVQTTCNPLILDWLMGIIPATGGCHSDVPTQIERLIVLGDNGVTDEWLHCVVMRIPHVYVIPCLQSTRSPHLLPQTPIHSCFFPKAHLFAGLHLCPNPFRLDDSTLFYAGPTSPAQMYQSRIVDPSSAFLRPDESGALIVDNPRPDHIFTFANTPSVAHDQQVCMSTNGTDIQIVSFAPLRLP